MSKSNRIACYFDYGGVLLVPVQLNAGRFLFMVDSGAAYCAINRKKLDTITAEPTAINLAIAPIGKNLVTTPALKIGNFSVGFLSQEDILVSIVDFPEELKLDGLLGMNFLGKYRFTIEPNTATLILHDIPPKKTK